MASAKGKAKPPARPGGPDSPEANRRDKVLSVRISDEARAELQALATRWGLSVSATVARLALEAAERAE